MQLRPRRSRRSGRPRRSRRSGRPRRSRRNGNRLAGRPCAEYSLREFFGPHPLRQQNNRVDEGLVDDIVAHVQQFCWRVSAFENVAGARTTACCYKHEQAVARVVAVLASRGNFVNHVQERQADARPALRAPWGFDLHPWDCERVVVLPYWGGGRSSV